MLKPKPRSLAELYGLAKLQEDNLNAMKSKSKMSLLSNSRYNGYTSTYPNSPKLVFSFEVVVDNDEKDIVWQAPNEDLIELLDDGVIRNNQSPFSSPIVMVKKKDGSCRMCMDYMKLNKHILKDKFPIPLIEELIDELCGSKVFSMSDLRSGYHKIRMYPDDIAKTAFQTHQGHYEFLNNKAEQAFEKLKEAMIVAPMLKLPNLEEDFVVETDAFGKGTGAMLQQQCHPVAYLSKDNAAADALSRIQGNAQLMQILVSTIFSDVQQRIKDNWTANVEIQALIAK
nr:retrotransposable element Tf2 [Tanacetum cinerariifolium]